MPLPFAGAVASLLLALLFAATAAVAAATVFGWLMLFSCGCPPRLSKSRRMSVADSLFSVSWK